MTNSLRDALIRTSVDAFYRGELDAGRAACEGLLSMASLSSDDLALTLRNEVFYAHRLAALAPSLSRRVVVPSAPGRVVREASPCPIGSEIALVLDETDTRGGRSAWSLESTGAGAGGFAPAKRQPLAGTGETEMERCRLVCAGDRAIAICAARMNPGRAVVLEIDRQGLALRPLISLQDSGGADTRAWMPFDSDGEVLLLTRCHPATVARPDGDAPRLVSEHPGPPIMGRLEVGSPGVRVGDGWLFALRQTALFEDGSRVVLHRFALLDDGFAWSALSEPFRFGDEQDRIERCSGLAVAGDRLAVGVVAGERRADLVVVSLAEVEAMLRPISAWDDSGNLPALATVRLSERLAGEMMPSPRLVPPRAVREAALAALRETPTPASDRTREQAGRRALVPMDEPDAIAAYREAEALAGSGHWAAAVDRCARAIAAGATIAELPWLAAFACWQAGADDRALAFAADAAALGWLGGRDAPGSPVLASAWFEGPADVERFAARRSGRDPAEAERRFAAALDARLAWEAAGGRAGMGEDGDERA